MLFAKDMEQSIKNLTNKDNISKYIQKRFCKIKYENSLKKLKI